LLLFVRLLAWLVALFASLARFTGFTRLAWFARAARFLCAARLCAVAAWLPIALSRLTTLAAALTVATPFATPAFAFAGRGRCRFGRCGGVGCAFVPAEPAEDAVNDAGARGFRR